MPKLRLTYANVVATVALVLALSGSAYALVITGADVKDGSLTSADIRDHSLLSSDLQSAGTPAGPRVWHVLQRDITDLPDAEGTELTIAKLSNLPGGNYLLSASTVASDFDDNGFVRCSIYVGTHRMNGALGSATRIGSSAESSQVAQITAVAVASKSSSFTASLRCAQTGGAPGARVEESHLYAIKTGPLVHRGDAQ